MNDEMNALELRLKILTRSRPRVALLGFAAATARTAVLGATATIRGKVPWGSALPAI